MNNYLIYNKSTGDVSTMIKTDDPMFLALNTPQNCSVMPTTIQNLNAVAGIDIAKSKIKLKP